MARTTQQVFDNHQAAFQSGDMAQLMADYANEVTGTGSLNSMQMHELGDSTLYVRPRQNCYKSVHALAS